jgi:hypothetical protein
MPYVNWLGWWFTGMLVAAVFWKADRRWRGEWEPAALALYLIQGAFMAGLAWLYMRPMATVLWLVAVTALMLLVKVRRYQQATSLQGVSV